MTMNDQIDKPNTGGPQRVFLAELKFQLFVVTDNKHCKPDIDKSWDESEIGQAWNRFLELAHAEGATLGEAVRVVRVYDEGPHIKRLQVDVAHLP
jgi:hypothetical protein